MIELKKITLILFLAIAFSNTWAQEQKTAVDSAAIKEVVAPPKKWYDQLSIKGYMQIRYNRLLETNDSLTCEQCDKSWGHGGFFIRRARISLSGNVGDRVFIMIQPDLAVSSGTSLNYFQLRDAYADFYLDAKKEYRFRLGQSKVPFGFENIQSSSIRLPLDRDDALNSFAANERDLGVFFYWSPEKAKKIFASLVHDGLKGSGDYGVFGTGIFNGQSSNKMDANKEPHVVARLTYPLEIKSQVIEAGVQAIKGNYFVETVSTGVKVQKSRTFVDERVAASFILYPKPFGIQAEYNVGRGPEFNKVTDSIETTSLKGGYVMASYLIKLKKQTVIPFIRVQYYDGGKKYETDARSYTVNEDELGVEWQLNKNLEFTAMYTISDRRFEDYALQSNHQKGSLLRLQAQINF